MIFWIPFGLLLKKKCINTMKYRAQKYLHHKMREKNEIIKQNHVY